MGNCPGQDTRKLTISYHPCPECQHPVEFFSDEMRQRCPQCRAVVQKDQTPSCIQWCESARECLGAEVYDSLMGKMCNDDSKAAE
jgi:hypothetical protein